MSQYLLKKGIFINSMCMSRLNVHVYGVSFLKCDNGMLFSISCFARHTLKMQDFVSKLNENWTVLIPKGN